MHMDAFWALQGADIACLEEVNWIRQKLLRFYWMISEMEGLEELR